LDNVQVVCFEGLLADYCKQMTAQGGKVAIVRGLRAVSDFESEMAIASLNLTINAETPTVFFPTEAHLAYVSSSAAKEMARYEGAHSALHAYVEAPVAQALIAKLNPVPEEQAGPGGDAGRP
jgi:pantetheine-phosphate adenylyltransferase